MLAGPWAGAWGAVLLGRPVLVVPVSGGRGTRVLLWAEGRGPGETGQLGAVSGAGWVVQPLAPRLGPYPWPAGLTGTKTGSSALTCPWKPHCYTCACECVCDHVHHHYTCACMPLYTTLGGGVREKERGTMYTTATRMHAHPCTPYCYGVCVCPCTPHGYLNVFAHVPHIAVCVCERSCTPILHMCIRAPVYHTAMCVCERQTRYTTATRVHVCPCTPHCYVCVCMCMCVCVCMNTCLHSNTHLVPCTNAASHPHPCTGHAHVGPQQHLFQTHMQRPIAHLCASHTHTPCTHAPAEDVTLSSPPAPRTRPGL